jgi:hypothetical protein
MRRTNTDGIAVCNGDCKCHAHGNGDYKCHPYGNSNSYWYNFTYTNSNGKAVAHAQISAYTEAAPDSGTETIGFGGARVL